MGRALIVPGMDFSGIGLGSITINGTIPLLSLSIKGPAHVTDSAIYSVSYYPYGTTQKGVTWSIVSGSDYATINSSTGEVAAKSGANDKSVIIRATSTYNNSISAMLEISVTDSGAAPTETGNPLQGFEGAYINATKYYSGQKYFPVEDTTFFIDFIMPSNRNYARSVYGGNIQSNTLIHSVMLSGSSLRIDDYSPTIGGAEIKYTQANGKRIKYTRTGRSYSIDIGGTVLTGSVGSQALSTEIEFYLFALYSNNGGIITANNIADGTQIYSAKLTLNGDTVFDVYPANFNGVVGMYDKVSGSMLGPEDGGYFQIVE